MAMEQGSGNELDSFLSHGSLDGNVVGTLSNSDSSKSSSSSDFPDVAGVWLEVEHEGERHLRGTNAEAGTKQTGELEELDVVVEQFSGTSGYRGPQLSAEAS